MNNPELRPRIVVSHCLGFEPCRYNGDIIKTPFLQILQPYVEYVFVCPEVGIGLGTPRDPVRLVIDPSNREENRLVQLPSGEDFTDQMQTFSRDFLDHLPEVDGFVLKSASPSCGLRDAKVYKSTEKGAALRRGPGLFAEAVLSFSRGGPGVRPQDSAHPCVAIEDEGRLKNLRLREHFLTRIFAFARFRKAAESGRMKELIRYQATHKLILMSYNQTEMRILGRIVANPDRKPFPAVVQEYRTHLARALSRVPRHVSNINVLMHAFGYFSKELSSGEKAFFLEGLEDYRATRIPLSSVTSVLNSWIIRFKSDYLSDQFYFRPFPPDLITLKDSGKGRLAR